MSVLASDSSNYRSMASRRSRRTRKLKLPSKPLVSNPFDAAKRKKSTNNNTAVSNSHNNKRNNIKKCNPLQNKQSHPHTNNTPLSIPSLSRHSTIASLSFGSPMPNLFHHQINGKKNDRNATPELNDNDDSNHSSTTINNCNKNPSWLRSTVMPSQSFSFSDEQQSNNSNSSKPELDAYLTPMPMDDEEVHRETALKKLDIINNRIFNHTKSKIVINEASNCHNDDVKTECIASGKLKVPLKNLYVDKEEQFDALSLKQKFKKGIVVNERYNIQYQEIDLLGNGSFGKVYKCRNRDDGCYYAIKKIKIRSIHKTNVKEKYMKEGMILSALQRKGICENIMLYNSMWIEHDNFYLVTEYCDHGNLYNLYNLFTFQQVMNDDMFYRILEHLSNALMFIHNKGFVHLDVKPENILISKAYVFKLADFGLCSKINYENEEKKVKFDEGDSRYLSRELIEETYNIRDVHKIDIFALGCSVYELIVRQDLPLNGFKWQQIRNGVLEWNDECNDNMMKQLITTMMHSDVNERPSANDLNLFLKRKSDAVLQEKEKQIQILRKKLQMFMQKNHYNIRS